MKTFEALFKLMASYTGGPAFANATKDIDKVSKRAKQANTGLRGMHASIGKMATAVGAAALAYKVAAEAAEFWREGVSASKEARDLQEKLGVAAERNAVRYKMSGAAIEKSVSGVSEKVAAVGFDSEDALAGTTKLLESMSPKQIEGFGEAYGNIVAKFKGATPGVAGFTEVSEALNKAVLTGKAAFLTEAGASDKDLKALKKMAPAKRLAWIQQFAANKLANEANRVMATTPGKVAKAAKAYEDLGQAVTKAVVGREGQLAETYEKAFKRLLPAAERIGAKLGDTFGHWADLLDENAEAIGQTIENIVETLGRAPDVALWVKAQLDKIPVLYDLPKNWPTLKKQWDQSISDTKRQLEDLGITAENWQKSVEDTKRQVLGGIETDLAVADKLGMNRAMWDKSIADTQRQAGEIGTAIRSGIESAMAVLAGIPASVSSALSGVYGAIVAPFQSAYDYISTLFSGLAGAIGAAASAAANAASQASTSVATAKAAAAAGTPVPRGAPGGPGESSTAAPAPYSYATQGYQFGGIATHPMVARLAERGIPEAVIPLQPTERAQSLLGIAQSLVGKGAGAGPGMQAGPVTFSPSINITVSAAAGTEAKTLASQVRRALGEELNIVLSTLKHARAHEQRLSYT